MRSSLNILLGAPTHKVIEGSDQFCRSLATIGPHPIPKGRQIANEFHRIFSPKGGMGLVECESPLEADALIWGESRPDVTAIVTQPLRIHGAVGNKPYHTLDIKFVFKDGTETYYEVKPEAHLKVQDDGGPTPANWPLIRSWFIANHKRCDVITDETLRPHAQVIENWRTLLPFAIESYECPDPALEKVLLNHLATRAARTFAGIEEREPTVSSQELTGHLAKLLHQGKLSASLSRTPVSPMTELYVVGGHRAQG